MAQSNNRAGAHEVFNLQRYGQPFKNARRKILDPKAKYYTAMERGVDDTRPMTGEQAATLKRLARAPYELDAFKPNLTRAEAGAESGTG